MKAIGCVELNSIAIGILAADIMVKTAAVELLAARTICPGRYLIMVGGDTASVDASVASGRNSGGEMVIDWFILANLHPSILPALTGTSRVERIEALGVIETYSTSACILAADAAAKAGLVDLIEIRAAAGLAGKAYVTMTGDVASVEASVQAGVRGVGESGPVVSHVVIPSPSEELKKNLL
jgi:microcompartment protein CcmL/EutN